MKKATFNTQYAITLDDMKSVWKVAGKDEIVMLDGTAFVNICAKSYTLRKLSREMSGDEGAQVATSRGYMKLDQLRNSEDKKLKAGETEQSNLFDINIVKKFTREALNQQRCKPRAMTASLSLDVGTKEVTMLRPVGSRDGLFVELSDTCTSIAAAMHMIMSHCFLTQAPPGKVKGLREFTSTPKDTSSTQQTRPATSV